MDQSSKRLLYAWLCIAELCRHLGTSRYWINELRMIGLVRFREGRVGGFDACMARLVDFLDVPVYPLGKIAKHAKVCTRTIRRWHRDGLIDLAIHPKTERLYATPRQLAQVVEFARERRRTPPERPNPVKTIARLGELGRRIEAPEWKFQTEGFRRRR